jgi:uncharacterized repeat protein (TIGR01451 family)
VLGVGPIRRWRPAAGLAVTSVVVVLSLAGAPSAGAAGSAASLWVANFSGSVTQYAPGADGDVAPITTISGANTGLAGPGYVAFDPAGRILVTNYLADTVTKYAPGASGDATPVATIAGPNTGLSAPLSIVVDAGGRIIVANGSGSVTVYAPDASGDATPIATIAGPNTLLDFTAGGTVGGAVALGTEPQGNLLMAVGPTNRIVQHARTASGDVAPLVTIAGPSTALTLPSGAAMGVSGNVFANNFSADTVTEYAAGASGDAAPIATIGGGATGLNQPNSITLDSAANLLVANNAGTVTEYVPGATGNVAPIATIAGGSTGLATPQSVVPDPAILRHPADRAVVSGQSASFDAFALGSPAPSIQWQVSADNGAGYSDLPGEIASTLTLASPATAQNANLYRARFAAGPGIAISVPARLAVAPAQTSTTLSLPATPTAGTALTLTATVAVSAPGAGAAGGTVQFYDGATLLGSGPLVPGAGGAASSLTTSALSAGTHLITAAYRGSADFAGSSSPSAPLVVSLPAVLQATPVVPAAIVSPTGDLTAKQRVSATSVDGREPITWTVTVTNRGPAASAAVTVRDTPSLPVAFTSIKGSMGACTTTTASVRCALGTLAAGASATIVIVGRARVAGTLSNVVDAASSPGAGAAPTTDPVAANNVSTVRTAVRGSLQLAGTIDRSTVRAGGRVAFRLRARNASRVAVRGGRICDRLPSGLVYAG